MDFLRHWPHTICIIQAIRTVPCSDSKWQKLLEWVDNFCKTSSWHAYAERGYYCLCLIAFTRDCSSLLMSNHHWQTAKIHFIKNTQQWRSAPCGLLTAGRLRRKSCFSKVLTNKNKIFSAFGRLLLYKLLLWHTVAARLIWSRTEIYQSSAYHFFL